ncbi:MAG: Pyrophosphatase PpaX [Paracidovorax wautersii]|uniref:Pyrophosphatase PpaX n=1 Tax=Paracidovorax wautersii TaxID=1177982 RepID=A0A7V8FQ78_9BURK|nr:MAG: Pyrophosphatase PpaX [Paracidovorax wautersii]
MTRQFDLLAFDWDGTLFDSTQIITRCLQDAIRDVGGEVPSDRDASYVIGLSLNQALQHAAPNLPPERYPQLMARYRLHWARHQDDVVLFPGALAMLQALKSHGFLLAVATGKSRRGLDEALHTVGLRGLFDASRTADETAGKPHPLMLQELMAEFGVAPSRTLMIGDTVHDLQMAINAGCASVGVSYGAHPPQGLIDLHPLFVAETTAELHDWLLRNA